MQDMGNTKARLLYEANLPENFRRPQTDQAVEFFIRDKYEKKKYYDKNAIAITNKEKEKKKEEKKREKEPEKPAKPLTTEKLQKKEDQQLEPKKSTSPKKDAEPTVDLLGLDGPAEAPVTNGNTTVPALNDDLDIFGPMISNPLPATVMPPAQVCGKNMPCFLHSLSSHGSCDAGVFMGPTNIPFTSQAPTAFQGFPSMGVPVPAAPGLIGNVMGQSASMMVGMPMPNGFMGSAQTGVMPLPQNVVGPQGGMVGQMGATQSKFGLPQAQQPQWNLSQVVQKGDAVLQHSISRSWWPVTTGG
uniref:Small ArfGAP 1 n=1 Tax=Propithecus coquereli TaxID=379532 RepID=A0A2K6FBL3_PROCO